MGYKVILTESFVKEYDSVINYHIETLAAPNAAKRLVEELYKAQTELSNNPKLYAISRKGSLMALELRERPVRNYILVYKLDGSCVIFEHLFHQSQDFESLI